MCCPYLFDDITFYFNSENGELNQENFYRPGEADFLSRPKKTRDDLTHASTVDMLFPM